MLNDHTTIARKNCKKFGINNLWDFVKVRFSLYLGFFFGKKKRKENLNYSIGQKVETD